MKCDEDHGKGGGEHHPDRCVRFTRMLSIGRITFSWNTKDMLEAEGRRRQREDGHPEDLHWARMNANCLTKEMNEMLLSRLTTQERNIIRRELAGFQHRLPPWMCGEDLQEYRQISQGFRVLPCPLQPSECPRCSQEMGGWVFRWTWCESSRDVAAEADPTEVPTEAAAFVQGQASKSSDAAPDRVLTDNGIEKSAHVLSPETEPPEPIVVDSSTYPPSYGDEHAASSLPSPVFSEP